MGLSAREERLQDQLGGYYDIPSETSAVRMTGTGIEIKKRSQNALGDQQILPRKESFINSFTASLLDSFTQHLAEDVLAEQWNLSIYHVLGVCQQLCKVWETLNGKDTSPDLNFLMYGVETQSADLSPSQRSLPPINPNSQPSLQTRPPSYCCPCHGLCSSPHHLWLPVSVLGNCFCFVSRVHFETSKVMLMPSCLKAFSYGPCLPE